MCMCSQRWVLNMFWKWSSDVHRWALMFLCFMRRMVLSSYICFQTWNCMTRLSHSNLIIDIMVLVSHLWKAIHYICITACSGLFGICWVYLFSSFLSTHEILWLPSIYEPKCPYLMFILIIYWKISIHIFTVRIHPHIAMFAHTYALKHTAAALHFCFGFSRGIAERNQPNQASNM